MNLIPDKEISLDEQSDLLGSRIYGEALYQVVSSLDLKNHSHTIGLFGGRGSGKSSIIKTFKGKLVKEKKTIKYILYDARKYSQDDFRRHFILQLAEDVYPADSDVLKELKEKLYCDTTKERNPVIGKVLLKNGAWLLMVLVVLMSLLVWLLNQWATNMNNGLVASIADKTYKLGLLVIFTYFVNNIFYTLKESVSTSKIFGAEQFEKEFEQILKYLDKYEKIVIVVDNLDRCNDDSANKALITIKGFLNKPKCLFIIPTDDKAIKAHLKHLNSAMSNEFLRKYFNTIIQIKPSLTNDFTDFTIALIKKYKLPFSNNVAIFASQQYSSNPRKIIQFLNKLYAEYLVLTEQQTNGLISNIDLGLEGMDLLAKLIILQEERPEFYTQILNSSESWEVYLREIGTNEVQENLQDEKEYTFSDGYSIKEDLYQFLSSTQGIESENIDSYIRLQNNLGPVTPKISRYLDLGLWDNIKDEVKEKGLSNEIIKQINKRVINKIIKYGFTTMETLGLGYTKIILGIFKEEGVITLTDDIYKLFSQLNFNKVIEKVDLIELIKLSYYLGNNGNTELIKRVGMFLNTNQSTEGYLEYIKTFESNGSALKHLKMSFLDFVLSSPEQCVYFEEYINKSTLKDLVFNKKGMQNKLLNTYCSEDTFTGGYNWQYNIAITGALKNDLLDKEDIIKYVNSIITHCNKNTLPTIEMQIDRIYSALTYFVLLDNETLENIKLLILPLQERLYTDYYNSGIRTEETLTANKRLIEICYSLYEITKDKSYITIINKYIENTGDPVLSLLANEYLGKLILDTDIYPLFIPYLISRYSTVNEADRQPILSTLIQTIEKVKIDGKDGLYNHMNIDQITTIFGYIYQDHFSKGHTEYSAKIKTLSAEPYFNDFMIKFLQRRDFQDCLNFINIMYENESIDLFSYIPSRYSVHQIGMTEFNWQTTKIEALKYKKKDKLIADMTISFLQANQKPYSLIDQGYLTLVEKTQLSKDNEIAITNILIPLLSEGSLNYVTRGIEELLKLRFISKDNLELIKNILSARDLQSEYNNNIKEQLLKRSK